MAPRFQPAKLARKAPDPRPWRAEPKERAARRYIEKENEGFGWTPILVLGLVGITTFMNVEESVKKHEQKHEREEQEEERRRRRRREDRRRGSRRDRSVPDDRVRDHDGDSHEDSRRREGGGRRRRARSSAPTWDDWTFEKGYATADEDEYAKAEEGRSNSVASISGGDRHDGGETRDGHTRRERRRGRSVGSREHERQKERGRSSAY